MLRTFSLRFSNYQLIQPFSIFEARSICSGSTIACESTMGDKSEEKKKKNKIGRQAGPIFFLLQ